MSTYDQPTKIDVPPFVLGVQSGIDSFASANGIETELDAMLSNTREIFGNDVRVVLEEDAEMPDDLHLVFEVTTAGDVDDVLGKEDEWHERCIAFAPRARPIFSAVGGHSDMNGRAFLNLALEFATSDAEERWRTSVSRAYYGAYHAARELIQTCDVIVPKRDVHNKLQWCLQQIGERAASKELTKAGSKLGDLRTERNKADYDLDDRTIAKVANVVKAVKRAEQIVDVLSAFTAGAANALIRQHVRSFAQQQAWQLR